MGRPAKYTREVLEPLVRESLTFSDVLRKLGKRQDGSVATHVANVIRRLEIDISHFLGRGVNCGVNRKGGTQKKPWEQILVHRPERDRRETAFRLRRALVESGRPYACEECGNDGVWQGKPLLLHVEHKNRDWTDNTPENISFLCPNCHIQTDGHSGSQGLTETFSRAKAEREYWRRKRAEKEDN